MAEYTLVYFQARGRAEPARLLFAAAGVNYEDKRLSREEWATKKADAPLQQLPYLEVKGKKLPQSATINRLLAHEFGMFGKSKLETATIDAITETVRDMEKPLVAWFHEKDEAKKKELKEELYQKKVPTILKALEKQLCENKEGDGWFVGDSITLADIVFFDFLGWLKPGNADLLSDFSKLKGLEDRVKAHPPIAAWLAKRPITEF